MRTALSALALLATMSPLASQVIDTIGGLGTMASRANTGKGSKFRVDTTSILLEYEMYLDVPGVETLTFFAYRLHSATGVADLVWTHNVNVDGTGVGPAWYSTGPIVESLVCGNHYLIGCAWPGTVSYFYDRGTGGDPVSFGAWMTGRTLAFPPAPTRSFSSGTDVAKYHQRLTTLPATSAVECIGTGCGGTRPPRLVADSFATRGATTVFHTADADPSSPAAYLFVLGGHTLATPATFLGCPVWLDLALGVISGTTSTSAAGLASVPLAIPNDPNLAGLPMSMQTVIAGGGTVGFTNALNITVN